MLLIAQNPCTCGNRGISLGVNEPPEGGKETARKRAAQAHGDFTRRFLGEDWAEVEPGIYYHQPGPLFRTVDELDAPTIVEALTQRATDVAGEIEPTEARTDEDSPEGILRRWPNRDF